jgi:hypothetical protein
MHDTDRNWLPRLVPLSGVAFAVLTVAGDLTIGRFPDTTASISELSTFYAAHHARVAAGGLLLGVAGIFLALFGTALWARIRATGMHPIVAGAALVGTAMAGVGALQGAAGYAIAGEAGNQQGLAPAALQALHIGAASGGIDGGSVILLLAAATAGIVGRALPRWLAWPAVALAILYFVPFGFLAVLLGTVLWTAVTGIVMTVRPAEEVHSTSGTAAAALHGGPALTSR